MPFVHLVLEVDENHAEFLSESLYENGSLGQEWREPHLLAMPNTPPPPPGKIHIVSFFKTLKAAKTALEIAKTQWEVRQIELLETEEKDWSVAWRERVSAVETRHLWVGPPWLPPHPGKHALYIEPKMAFGTGDHPSTWLCLEEIDTFCSTFPNATLLDVGTGTGILGMAACKLGASRVLGIDNDAIALSHAQENIALNQINNMHLSEATLPQIHEQFHLVVANIFANALRDLAADLCKKTQKYLVLSGILAHQSAELETQFLKLGMQLSVKHALMEWVCLGFKKR